MSDLKEQCSGCKFWFSPACLRYPPTVIYDTTAVLLYRTIQRVPETMPDDWCGEFAARAAAKEER